MQHSLAIEKNPVKGILMCALAYCFISLVGFCVKALSSHVTIPMVLFTQNLICLLLLVPELSKQRLSYFKTTQIATYVIRIASGLGCYATFFYLAKQISISEALIYQYSASLWIPFITLAWFNIRMPSSLWYGIIIGFVGIAFIIQPTTATIGIVSIVGILCGVLQGVSVVAIRKLSVSEPLSRILFYYFLTGVIVAGFFLEGHWNNIEFNDASLLLGIGLCSYVAQKLITISLQYASAATLAPICYTSILFSGLLGWILWQEIPARLSMIGMILVIGGCLLSLFISQQNTKLAEQ